MWTTEPPRLSFAAAAAKTSMARNGATRSSRRAKDGETGAIRDGDFGCTEGQ
jgi:hypothetical protein